MRIITSGAIATALFMSASACSSPVQPLDNIDTSPIPIEFTRSLATAPATYVLAKVEAQDSEPIVLFDHSCARGRIVQTVRDTITFHADGTMRRAFVLTQTTADLTPSSSAVEMRGRWSPFTSRNYYFFSEGPSITLTYVNTATGAETSSQMRLMGTTGLIALASLGGSCPGSPGDGREAQFVYTRR